MSYTEEALMDTNITVSLDNVAATLCCCLDFMDSLLGPIPLAGPAAEPYTIRDQLLVVCAKTTLLNSRLGELQSLLGRQV